MISLLSVSGVNFQASTLNERGEGNGLSGSVVCRVLVSGHIVGDVHYVVKFLIKLDHWSTP